MKTLIVYYSVYRNHTKKIAEVMAKKLNADLVNIKNISDIKSHNYDLIGFGSGVYKESMAIQVFKCVEKLSLQGKKVFVFSTSGVGLQFYNKKLIKLLEEKGANCIGSFACKGSFDSSEFSDKKIFEFMSKFSESHPNDKDIRKADDFIERIRSLSI